MNRIAYLDWCKLIALLLVVYCHIPPCDNAFHVITYSYHMPLFFIISGMLYNKQDISTLCKRGTKTLLIPYLTLNLVAILIYAFIALAVSSFNIEKNLINPLLGTLFGSTDQHAPYPLPLGPSWFLLALFVARIGCAWTVHSSTNILWIIKISVIILMAAVLPQIFDACLWSLDSAATGSLFMLVGYYMKPFVEEYRNKKKILNLSLIILIPALCGLALFNEQTDMFSATYGKIGLPLFFVTGILGTCSMLIVCNNAPDNRYPIFLSVFMKASLFIICMQLLYLDYAALIFRKLSGYDEPFQIYHKLTLSLSFFILSYGVVRICPQRLNFFIGK